VGTEKQSQCGKADIFLEVKALRDIVANAGWDIGSYVIYELRVISFSRLGLRSMEFVELDGCS
jgi:hypothetical protein